MSQICHYDPYIYFNGSFLLKFKNNMFVFKPAAYTFIKKLTMNHEFIYKTP